MCEDVKPEKKTKILQLTVSTPVEEAIGQAIGLASMCWETLDDAGAFNSELASQITDELVEYIGWKQPIY